MEKPTYILFDKRQTLGESLVSDGATFGLLLLCIWISQGSKWWTFFSALCFLGFGIAKCAAVVGNRQHKFKSLDELEEWAAKERSNA